MISTGAEENGLGVNSGKSKLIVLTKNVKYLVLDYEGKRSENHPGLQDLMEKKCGREHEKKI